LCDLGSCDGGVTGQEEGHPGASIVYNSQYCIKSLRFGKSCDQIQGYLCEWWGVFWNSDFVKWGFLYVREVFVLLAGCTSLDVLFDPGPL